jgi:hypothetical protein
MNCISIKLLYIVCEAFSMEITTKHFALMSANVQ